MFVTKERNNETKEVITVEGSEKKTKDEAENQLSEGIARAAMGSFGFSIGSEGTTLGKYTYWVEEVNN